MKDGFKDIKASVNEFLLMNQDRYQILTDFQEHLNDLSPNTYDNTIQLIESHSSFFFDNHSSAIFFFFNIIRTSQFNFKIFELYMSICIHFASQLKSANTTENELIIICMEFPNSINYLFSQGFFRISSIIELSAFYIDLFINFLPEIEKYDPMYSKLREEKLFEDPDDPLIQTHVSFYNYVKSNPADHVLNRNLNYHPSSLHKSIRDDDFDTFQKILSQNNYSVNHKIEYSRYERSKTIDKELSLIQIAAVYGSLTIFKFLWISKRIVLSKNLLSYAYYGYNFEIIHLCEQKCSYQRVYIQPMLFRHNELLNYYIENFGFNIHESNEAIKTILLSYRNNEEDEFYRILSSDCLKNAVYSFNFPIIESCLQKIVYIIQKVELKFDLYYKYDSFLKSSKFDFSLFEFLFNRAISSHKCEFAQRVNLLINLMKNGGNDSFKFVFESEKNVENLLLVFRNSLRMNHDISLFILDKMIDDREKSNGNENELFSEIRNKIDFNDLLNAIQYYNEDIVIKFIELKDFFGDTVYIQKFISNLANHISVSMMNSLFVRFSSLLHESVLAQMRVYLDDPRYLSICNIIMKRLSENKNISCE